MPMRCNRCYIFSSDTFSKPVSGSSEAQQSSGWFKVFTVAAYQPYFDVDTSDVLERIKGSLLPFGGSFNEKTARNPDLMLLLFNESQSYNLQLKSCKVLLIKNINAFEEICDLNMKSFQISNLK
uniref:Uncharacterized protein n=1 Tax=Lactuca sativa TaxID=4236 RepID=A0A9R1XVT2_LACSA|nr:hypothetical protein LSAT_V11C200087170 [Lactuca sativa]